MFEKNVNKEIAADSRTTGQDEQQKVTAGPGHVITNYRTDVGLPHSRLRYYERIHAVNRKLHIFPAETSLFTG